MKLFALCFGGQHYVIKIFASEVSIYFVFISRVRNPSISCWVVQFICTATDGTSDGRSLSSLRVASVGHILYFAGYIWLSSDPY
jgi:hypothetical protein